MPHAGAGYTTPLVPGIRKVTEKMSGIRSECVPRAAANTASASAQCTRRTSRWGGLAVDHKSDRRRHFYRKKVSTSCDSSNPDPTGISEHTLREPACPTQFTASSVPSALTCQLWATRPHVTKLVTNTCARAHVRSGHPWSNVYRHTQHTHTSTRSTRTHCTRTRAH